MEKLKWFHLRKCGKTYYPDMKRKVEYHPAARAEIHNTANWYDNRTEGLGLEFLLEVRFAESQIIQHSDMWPIYEGDTRRYLLKKLFLIRKL